MKSRGLTAALLCSSLVAIQFSGCQRSGVGDLEKDLPKELLDVLPVGEKRPLEVVMSSPRNEMAELAQGDQVVISFNQPMVPLRPVGSDEPIDFLEITPKLAGRFRWKGTATLVFEPKTSLPYATRFQVTVKKGVKSWAGQELKSDFKFEFTTPTVRLAHSLPLQNSAMQGPNEPIYLHFNQPVLPELAQKSISLRQQGSEIPITVRAYNDEDRKVEDQSAKLQDAYELPRDSKGEVAGPSNQALVVLPSQPLKNGAPAQLILKSGLMGPGGSVGSSAERTIDFTVRSKFEMSSDMQTTGFDPESGFYLRFTTPVSALKAAQSIEVSPSITRPERSEDNDYNDSSIYLGGELKPNTSYKITVKDGLVDAFGAKLEGKREITLTTGDYFPLLLGPQGTGLLELKGGKRIPYGARNLTSLTAAWKKLTPAEVIAVNGGEGSLYSDRPFTPKGGFTQTLNLGGNKRRNEIEERQVSLPGGGLYYLQVSGSDNNSARSLVAVTDLGVTAKYSADNLLVYTTSLNDASSVSGAEIEIYDAGGKKLWSGRTDAEGFCQAPGWAKLGLKKKESWETPDLWVFAKSGQSQTFVHSSGYNSVSPWNFEIDYDSSADARRFQAFAFSERGVYRPGESVQLKGSLREISEGSWKLPDVDHVRYVLFDSRDKEVSQGQLKTNRFGGFDQQINLKNGAPTGLYRVEYSLPQKLSEELKSERLLSTVTFQVEAFKPAQFEVSVTPDRPNYVMGDKAKVEYKGWYLFGAPMNDRPLKWTARVEPASLRPDGFEGYDFGLYEDSEADDESKVLASEEVKLDAQGLVQSQLSLDKVPFKGSAHLILEGIATSPNRQELAGRKVIPLHRGEVQLGLRSESFFGTAKEAHKLEVVAVRPDGQTQQGCKVKMELLRREWNSVRKADPSGGYSWVSEVKDEPVGDQEVSTSTKPTSFSVTPPKAGYYVVRASHRDSRGNVVISESGFYVSGSDYVGWARAEGDDLELVPDKKKYGPGDTAKILVKSPYEKTRALVTLEREHVMDRFVVDLVGSTPTIQIPLTSRHLPNVYVSVMLLQGRGAKAEYGPDGEDLSKPGFKIGYANLAVEPSEKRLQVKVKTAKEKYAPGDEVVADFEVRDAAGNPVEAELCVAVPDQGVLALTGYTLPDWFSAFYGPRPLSVTTCETRMDVIGQRAYGTKGANAGGGGAFDATEGRDDFRYTAYWNASLTSDSSGKAQVRFTLPDNLTTFKVMAMAQSERSQFGSAESKFEVAKPLLLQPSAPDFARKGDRFKAGVVVRNNTDAKVSAKISLNAEGVVLLDKSAEQQVELGAGKEQEVLFELEAKELGQASLTFQCEGGEHHDSLKLPLSIQQQVQLENVGTSGSTTDSAALELVVPSPMTPGTGSLALKVANTALVELVAPLQKVVDNGWIGLEPQLSNIRALMARKSLSLALDQVDAKVDLQAKLDALAEYAADSGFRAYLFTRPDAYFTAYTLETLEMGRKNGLKPDQDLIDKARSFLKTYVDNGNQKLGPWESERGRLITRCYALYALALGKFEGVGYFNNLMRNHLELPLEARAYLLRAGLLMGAQANDLETLRQDLLNAAKTEASTVYFQEGKPIEHWSFTSNNRLSALVLGSLLETPAGYPSASKVVDYLMLARRKSGDWGNSLANIMVMENLLTYINRQESERPNFKAKAFLQKEAILEASFLSREPKQEKVKVSVKESPQKLAVGIKKDGPGRLYYDLRLSYVSEKEPPARDEGLALLKKISNLKGDRFPSSLKAGENYMVTLTVVSPRDRRFVVVNDPLPAGCEVVQTQFETASAELSRILSLSQGSLSSTTFSAFEKYPDRVSLFADGLQAGEHTFQYLMRANQPGLYQMPASKAEEMYHPEIFGTTLSRKVEIR
jgi:uncharacterized protein YfaS (alpha-2-macroglobulin family)